MTGEEMRTDAQHLKHVESETHYTFSLL